MKINTVALKGINEDEFPRLIEWAHGRGMDLTLIEVMPLGEIGEGRLDQYLPLSMVRARFTEHFSLDNLDFAPAARRVTSVSPRLAAGSALSPR